MKPSSARGIIKATKMRNQLITSILSGVTTGALEGLICVFGTGVAAEIAVVPEGVLVDITVLLDWECAAVLRPPVKAKTPCDSTPISTSVVANRSGFSESAGVTRYQCPSHIAVITPPSASAPAKKLPTTNAPAGPDVARGRKIIPNTNNVAAPASTSKLPTTRRSKRNIDPRTPSTSSSSFLNFPSTPAFLSINSKIV